MLDLVVQFTELPLILRHLFGSGFHCRGELLSILALFVRWRVHVLFEFPEGVAKSFAAFEFERGEHIEAGDAEHLVFAGLVRVGDFVEQPADRRLSRVVVDIAVGVDARDDSQAVASQRVEWLDAALAAPR